MTAWYNEIDPYAAQWLRNLIAAGHIAPGVVDERGIRDVEPDELADYTQCHFFAGIGIWSHALRSAGWPDDRVVWTGSCPCQPFSQAGKQQGFDDTRHLWPHWFRLIAQCRPPVVLGEQVASALAWLDLVSADMEGADYAFGASDLCAAGFGGAHIRQRLYFVGLADDDDARLQGRARVPERAGECAAGPRSVASRLADAALEQLDRSRNAGAGRGPEHSASSSVGGLAKSDSRECNGLSISEGCESDRQTSGREQGDGSASGNCEIERLANSVLAGRPEWGSGAGDGQVAGSSVFERLEHPDLSSQHRGAPGREQPLCDGRDRRNEEPAIRNPRQARLLDHDNVDWLLCRNPAGEPSWRPVESGTFPLAHGIASRMGKLRAYGNGLDAETATQFCEAVIDALRCP